MALKTCNICEKQLDISSFATFFVKARNKTYTENRCRICKNNVAKHLMREKAKLQAELIANGELTREEVRNKKKNAIPRPEPVPLSAQELKLHRAKETAQKREYFAKNRDKLLEARRKLTKEKMKDGRERVKRNMKTLLVGKIHKNTSSTTYFGTSMQLILQWLEFNFTRDINWDNYGAYWHIDHVIAIDLWDLENEAEKMTCFNWKNLMPLERFANIKKGSTLQPARIFYQEQRLRLFFKENDMSENLDDYLNKYSKKFKDLLPEFYMQHTSIAGTPL